MKYLKENWGSLLLMGCLLAFVTYMILWMVADNKKCKETKEYCGNVIDIGYDPPSSGYKSSREAQYWTVIMDEDIHKAIRIHVTPACYYSLVKGNRECFNLTASEMMYYGNTSESKHLK